MGKTAPAPGEAEGAEHLYAAPDTAREIGQWLAYLGAERRMSPETVEAYGRDVRQFLRLSQRSFRPPRQPRHAERARDAGRARLHGASAQ